MHLDILPTDSYKQFKIRRGFFRLTGSTIIPNGVNFCIYSSGATSCELVLFKNGEKEPFATIPYPDNYRVGNVFAMIVFDLDYENIEYGFRIDGRYEPEKGYIYDRTKILSDPYARLMSGRNEWGVMPDPDNIYQYRSKVAINDFDLETDPPMKSDHSDLIIYEAHLRGFTRHGSSGVKHPGTYAGFIEKIPYLKELGINAVEFLPIFEFDENEDVIGGRVRYDSKGNRLLNYWGYNPISFFAPKAGYAASGKYYMQIYELKHLIKELHKNNIKVILDVVFNHTGEGDERGPYISFKGIDNKAYYILDPDGKYCNYSGCGNTLNCNNPIVRQMILNCLRHWIAEYHIDGFRFDLASILGRNQDGSPMTNPPLLELLTFDPLLNNAILIAEAWDAAGLYQVGTFPAYGRWAEWNGRYRDDIRHFIKGDTGFARAFAERITGSEDIYNPAYRGDYASINFITCHDGFTLWDLFSYNEKHNEENGWNNTDGNNDNLSWNCGSEGDTDDPEVLFLRRKMVRNAATILLCSIGIPMILAGDEFCNTQFGNNNAYCQDNEISWLDWNMLSKNHDMFEFFKELIAFRKRHPLFRKASPGTPENYPPVSLHGINPWQFDDSPENRVVCILLTGKLEDGRDDFIYICANAHWESHRISLPSLPNDHPWQLVINTEFAEKPFFPKESRLNIYHQSTLSPRSISVYNAVIQSS